MLLQVLSSTNLKSHTSNLFIQLSHLNNLCLSIGFSVLFQILALLLDPFLVCIKLSNCIMPLIEINFSFEKDKNLNLS